MGSFDQANELSRVPRRGSVCEQIQKYFWIKRRNADYTTKKTICLSFSWVEVTEGAGQTQQGGERGFVGDVGSIDKTASWGHFCCPSLCWPSSWWGSSPGCSSRCSGSRSCRTGVAGEKEGEVYAHARSLGTLCNICEPTWYQLLYPPYAGCALTSVTGGGGVVMGTWGVV